MTSSPTWAPEELDGIRILIVEDNQDSADALEELLKLLGGTVAVARDGPQALQVAKHFAPQVILLDLGLPGMHGTVVARRLREQVGPEKALRIIAVSGYGHRDVRGQADAEEFFAYFVKPVAFDELVRAILAP